MSENKTPFTCARCGDKFDTLHDGIDKSICGTCKNNLEKIEFLTNHFNELFIQRNIIEDREKLLHGFIYNTRESIKQLNGLKKFKISFELYDGYEESVIVEGVTKEDAQREWLTKMNPETNQNLDCWDIEEVEPKTKEAIPKTN
ncbi:MAG: hypothetical protein K5790_10475 [Nitrosopumilus sp.]|uniref:hypothetical protein n=1 Tax=Nitrosopumilus sp. TaxID=2024843 RepID=UPI00247C39BC|nr:hypothetical protein [Nitrosopumilus sp.]MCV0393695.1 hypothetical protein [Nitrosopumilus sp.]